MKSRRIATWWLSLEDLDFPNAKTLEKNRRRAKEYADANVTTVYLFGAHFRFDFIHRLDSLHGLIKNIADECHRYGMEVVDHHSVNLIHRYRTEEERKFIMKNSGPHLPLCPSFEEAENWEFGGHRLNDVRMISTVTGKPLWHPQYQGEGFCHRNPEFIDMYIQYAKKLIEETGIDGLEADDSLYYMHYQACGCKYCREELKKRSGIDLPPAEDKSFWGNYDNPAWRDWIDLRFEAAGNFMEKLRDALPKDFLLMYCGSRSASGIQNGSSADVRQFLRGANYVSIELSGNTPPYKHDPHTINFPVSDAIVNGSHHLAAAREKGTRCYGISFGFTEATANVCWAVNKMAGADCLFCTLKARLGLPDEILQTLPEEGALVKKAYTFEKNHKELFAGEACAQLAVYFSYETRNHSLFGNLLKGYPLDYSKAVESLMGKGFGVHTVFDFPENGETYPLVVLPSPWRMTEEEKKKLHRYLQNGGHIIACGPAVRDLFSNEWNLPNAVNESDPEAFMQYVNPGETVLKQPKWMYDTFPPSTENDAWREMEENCFYNPQRISDLLEGENSEAFFTLVKHYTRPLPMELVSQEGYLTNLFRSEAGYTMHFLAADYETDIDHHLDEIRFHRSRVNLITKAEPAGVSREIVLKTAKKPVVYTPFCEEAAVVESDGETVKIRLPENCAYAILEFKF